MADRSLPNYPAPIGGSSKINVTTHEGPLLYVAGGEAVQASTFGWGRFDHVQAGQSFNANNTGNYTVRVLYPKGQTPATANNNISGEIPTGSNNVNLLWIVNATGNEAANNTNLTGEYVRVSYFGG